MFPVSEIWDETKKLLGNCTDKVAYQKLNRAIEILANKADWDPLTGFMDISCDETKVTLPREIETPLTISYGKYPALAYDQLFRFHLNGPGGKCICVDWRWWQDGPEAVTFRDLDAPAPLAATAEAVTDIGRIMWAYGYDADDQPIRTEIDAEMVDGYPITIQDPAAFIPDPAPPFFARITRIRKPESTGPVKLWSVNSGELGTLLGVYSWDDVEPKFRRLLIDRPSDVVRIHYRRKNFAIRSQTDLIPLHSVEAVLMMLQALRSYNDKEFETAMAAEATAVRWLTEEQASRNPSIATPMQMLDKPDCEDYLE